MPKFGDLENAIMAELWAAERPLFVREVLERLNRGLAYNTVQTVTDILYRKGWLTKEREGRAFRYAPSSTRDDYVAGLVREALLLTDDRNAALVGFLAGIKPQEAEELHRLLSAARENDADP